MKRKTKNIIFVIAFLVQFFLVLSPTVISWADRIEPRVGPFTFFMFFTIFIGGFTIWLTLIVLYFVELKTKQLEPNNVDEIVKIENCESLHPSERALVLLEPKKEVEQNA